MKEHFKRIAENLPYPIGKTLSVIPMNWRLGGDYQRYKRLSTQVCVKTANNDRYFASIRAIVKQAFYGTRFYNDLYTRHNISPDQIQGFKDFREIPIATKTAMQQYSLSDRSTPQMPLKKSNTGGTTGQPLSFYLEKSAYAREWAHMHSIWESLDYRHTDEKITLRGRNIGKKYYKYNFNQNEFLINAYSSIDRNIDECRRLVLKHDIQWIHGYPSSVYSFLRELEEVDSSIFEILIKKLKGAFLGSEYPAPQYRRYLEHHCRLKVISWYGHSEMAVLAAERESGTGLYYPFYSYGFPEAIASGNSYRLIATSIHNFATPFVRYDTGDLIDPTFKNGHLECFQIREGRNSDCVVDKNGRSISLTGLIFGRHHLAFNHCEHVQVRQSGPGEIEIVITSRTPRGNWNELFDFSNCHFDVAFTQVSAPITSAIGKVQLLLPKEQQGPTKVLT